MATEAKKSLRLLFKHKLSAIEHSDVIAQSTAAEAVILALPQYKAAQRVGIYLSMPTGEAQTDLLVRDALSNGKAVFVPYLYSPPEPSTSRSSKRKVMDMVRLNSLEDYQGLQRDSWGIPTLPAQSIETRENAMGGKGITLDESGIEKTDDENNGLDMIVMPGVAFDRDMNRMGHGAGFYDSFLSRFCAQGRRERPYLVGLCLAEQVLPKGQTLVMQDWDWKVDAVAVGDGNLLASKDVA